MGFNYSFDKDEPHTRLSAGNRRRSWFFAVLFTLLLLVLVLIFRPAQSSKNSGEAAANSAASENSGNPGSEGSGAVNAAETKFSAEQEKLYNDAAAAIAAKDFLRGKQLAEMLVRHLEIGGTQWFSAVGLLNRANSGIVFNKVKCDKNVVYDVKSGDTFSRLSDKLNTTLYALWKINDLPEGSSDLKVGDKITCYKGDWSVEINKKAQAVCVMDGNELFLAYPAGFSSKNKIPAGEYSFPGSKKKQFAAGGDRRNRYGTRFMGFNNTSIGGIHGTWDAGDVRGEFNDGYIRMNNADVEMLFMLLPGGTKVKIVD